MQVTLNFKDEGATSGVLHGEVTIDFNINMEKAMDVLRKLQESNVPGAIAEALSKKEPEGDAQ